MDYWKECISIAADDCGLELTAEQLDCLAWAAESGHEFYGQAHGYDVIGNPLETQAQEELRKLKLKIEKQENWTASTAPCRSCTTKGYVIDGWGRDMTCQNCDGKGRVRL